MAIPIGYPRRQQLSAFGRPPPAADVICGQPLIDVKHESVSPAQHQAKKSIRQTFPIVDQVLKEATVERFCETQNCCHRMKLRLSQHPAPNYCKSNFHHQLCTS